MERQERVERVLELAETTREALEHIKTRMGEGKREETIKLYTDVIEAFATIEAELERLPKVKESLSILTASLREGMDLLAQSYEQGSSRYLEIIQITVIPRYQRWQEELTNRLKEYFPA